jgi:hypothetical protein
MTTRTLDLRVKADEKLQKKVVFLQDSLSLTNGELVKLAISRLYDMEVRYLKNMTESSLVKQLVNAQKKKQHITPKHLDTLVEKERTDWYESNS